MVSKLMAKMFNRKAAGPKAKSGEIVSTLRIKKGDVIADIGAGGGHFTQEFARKAGKKGKVYAVDINPGFLKFIAENASRAGIANITTVKADSLDTIPLQSVNLAFLRNVYHHIPDPKSYFADLKKYLRPDGRIAIIDYKQRQGFSFHNLFGHNVNKDEIIASLKAAGFKLVKKYNFLPDQEFLIFGFESQTR